MKRIIKQERMFTHYIRIPGGQKAQLVEIQDLYQQKYNTYISRQQLISDAVFKFIPKMYKELSKP